MLIFYIDFLILMLYELQFNLLLANKLYHHIFKVLNSYTMYCVYYFYYCMGLFSIYLCAYITTYCIFVCLLNAISTLQTILLHIATAMNCPYEDQLSLCILHGYTHFYLLISATYRYSLHMPCKLYADINNGMITLTSPHQISLYSHQGPEHWKNSRGP